MRRRFIKSCIGLGLAMTLTLIYPASASAPTFHKLAPKKLVSLAKFDPKAYARLLLSRKGLGFQHFKCLETLWMLESHWNPKAHNPTSTAYGIWQGLIETSHDPATQIRNGLRYISYRYNGSPCLALDFHLSHGYY